MDLKKTIAQEGQVLKKESTFLEKILNLFKYKVLWIEQEHELAQILNTIPDSATVIVTDGDCKWVVWKDVWDIWGELINVRIDDWSTDWYIWAHKKNSLEICDLNQKITGKNENKLHEWSKENNDYKNFLLKRKFYSANRSPDKLKDDEVIKIRTVVLEKIKNLNVPKWITLRVSKPEDIVWKISSDGEILFISPKNLFDVEKDCNTRIWTVNLFELDKWLPVFQIWDNEVYIEHFTEQMLMLESWLSYNITKFDWNSVDLVWEDNGRQVRATVWIENIYKKL